MSGNNSNLRPVENLRFLSTFTENSALNEQKSNSHRIFSLKQSYTDINSATEKQGLRKLHEKNTKLQTKSWVKMTPSWVKMTPYGYSRVRNQDLASKNAKIGNFL